MNGRVYDPQIGRFISADPTVPDPMYSQDFNRYSYVDNSPLEYTDPSGFDPCSGDSVAKNKKADGSGGKGGTCTGSHIPGVDVGCSGCSPGSSANIDVGGGTITTGGSRFGGNSSSSSTTNSSSVPVCNPICSYNQYWTQPPSTELGPILVTGQPYFELNPVNPINNEYLQLTQGLNGAQPGPNGEESRLLDFLNKHSSVDVSLHAALGIGIIVDASFAKDGVTLHYAYAPGIGLDLQGGLSESLLNDGQGFFSGLDISGGGIIGGDLFFGAGESGVMLNGAFDINAGWSIQAPFGYTTETYSYGQVMEFFNYVGHNMATNPLISGVPIGPGG